MYLDGAARQRYQLDLGFASVTINIKKKRPWGLFLETVVTGQRWLATASRPWLKRGAMIAGPLGDHLQYSPPGPPPKLAALKHGRLSRAAVRPPDPDACVLRGSDRRAPLGPGPARSVENLRSPNGRFETSQTQFKSTRVPHLSSRAATLHLPLRPPVPPVPLPSVWVVG